MSCHEHVVTTTLAPPDERDAVEGYAQCTCGWYAGYCGAVPIAERDALVRLHGFAHHARPRVVDAGLDRRYQLLGGIGDV